MPTPENLKNKFYEVDIEPEYVRYMQGLKARFQTIALSETFKKAAGKSS